MPTKDYTGFDPHTMGKCLLEVLGEAEVETIARECKMVKRLRKITPLGLLVACLSTLGAGEATWLADIVRSFNAFTGKTVQYKPFHNQLAKAAFPEFLRRVLEAVLTKLSTRVLMALPKSKLSMFTDILLHDGSSFALKDSLAESWPGRFTKISPAAVELHVTMSALDNQPLSITLAADKESERQFAPAVEDLKGCLLLEDRGYEDRQFFLAAQKAGAFFIVRGKKNIKPTIRRAYDSKGCRVARLEGKRLSWRLLPREDLDLEIEWPAKNELYQGRIVVFYKPGARNKKTYTYLHTNLDRTAFSIEEVGQLYRLRWQIELLFKEWKSHANLHAFDTSKATIAEGLIWGSLIAATLKRSVTHAAEIICRVELSTQRSASSAKHFLDEILRALLGGNHRFLTRAIHQAFTYLAINAQRAHPGRDRRTGRLAAGLRPIGVS